MSSNKKYSSYIKPMLAKLGGDPFSDPDWLFEIKWDGYRAIAELDKGKVKFYSRNGLSFEGKYPEIAEALEKIDQKVVLDGEIVVLDKDGKPDFQQLQHYPETDEGAYLVYYAFDILEMDGHKLDDQPLLKRKELLKELIPEESIIKYSDHLAVEGESMFAWVEKQGIEGIMAKQAQSTYSRGKRTGDWLKIRNHNMQEVVICGYTDPAGGRKYFGSLVLGIYREGELSYAGNAGTGFDNKSLKELSAMMEPLETKTSPFKKPPKDKDITWIKPQLVCNVKYTEWTRDGKLRHPVFMGLRIDKKPTEVVKDNDKKEDMSTTSTKAATAADPDREVKVGGYKVQLTNQDKIYFPGENITKGDIVDYYQRISKWILPYLKDRPQSLKRNPNGINQSSFYHKDAGENAPEFVDVFSRYSESANKDIDYIVCNNKATLMYLNNLGCIELNPWNSRIATIDRPDFMVIDLDPSDKNTFEQVIEAALATKEILDQAGAASFCKTSGSTGMHVYVPMGAKYDYDQVRDFAKLIALLVQDLVPDFTTLERSLSKRGKDEMYLDFLQNRPGQTLAAPYCVRPRKGATVSTPLEWAEVKKGLSPADFTIFNIEKRLEKKGDLFKGVLGKAIKLEKCLEKLGA